MTLGGTLRRFALDVMQSLRAAPVFMLAVLIAPGLAGLFGLMVVLMSVAPGLLPGRFAQMGHGMAGFGGHRDHASPVDTASELAIGADQMAFHPDRIQLNAGDPVNVVLTSKDTLHDLVVDEIGFYLVAGRSQTARAGSVFYEPGTYVDYGSVPGHREAAMEIEIVVTGGSHDPADWRRR